ncbi:RbsD/FucU family protein [Aureimonas sp. N4]|uniref:RbsD/FucU family protein n=1 Tax=Aureimonas sp. N4 TaxID=1638165 RepID=UPI0007814882|nr:RbsD/FucU domain-containing protein [Aureimonas sp. N4]
MLKTLDPILTPDLLWVLAAMGHGDDIALVDGNFPAESVAAETISGELVNLGAVPIDRAARAILSLLPLDGFVDDPVRCMEVVGKPDEVPEPRAAVRAEIEAAGESVPIVAIERYAFYEAAKKSFAVVKVADPRFYGCFLLRKGVIAGGRPTY